MTRTMRLNLERLTHHTLFGVDFFKHASILLLNVGNTGAASGVLTLQTGVLPKTTCQAPCGNPDVSLVDRSIDYESIII